MHNLMRITAALLAVATTPLAAKTQPVIGMSKVAQAINQQVVHERSAIYTPQLALPSIAARQTNNPLLKSNSKPLSKALLADEPQCNDEAFVTSGANLLAQIKNQGYDCVERLFGDASDAVLVGTFTEQNILSVAAQAKTTAIAYQGSDPGLYLRSLHYWIRAFYFYGNRELLTPTNQQATKDAMDALVGNSHFYDKTVENSELVDIAIVNLSNASIGEHYIATFSGMLDRYSLDYENTGSWGDAMASISWTVMNSCSRFADCRTNEFSGALAKKIGDFMHNNIDWLKKSTSDYHLHNLGYQLANMYSSRNDGNFPALKPVLETQLNKIFTRFGPYKSDVARRAYLMALDAVELHNQCSVYQLCNKTDEIITNVLGDRINCPSGTLFMWAQDMNQAQLVIVQKQSSMIVSGVKLRSSKWNFAYFSTS